MDETTMVKLETAGVVALCKERFFMGEVAEAYMRVSRAKNFVEEINEGFEAKEENDKVDAVVDVIIFAISNSVHLVDSSDEYLVEIQKLNLVDFDEGLTLMQEKFGTDTNNIQVATNVLVDLGYDHQACLYKALAHIAKRRQDPKQVSNRQPGEKWRKDPDQELVNYVDYSNCKIGETSCES